MNHQNNIDSLFSKAANQPVVASFGETKELFLETTPIGSYASRSKSTRIFTFKNGLIMIAILSTILATLLLIPSESHPKNTAKETAKTSNSIVPKTETFAKQKADTAASENVTSYLKKPLLSYPTEPQIADTASHPRLVDSIPYESDSVPNKKENTYTPPPVKYRFPVLTDEEITEHRKRKKKMMKDYAKLTKSKTLAYIPGGSCNFHGDSISVTSFYMRTTEVSNIEYKTFLTDLLIEGKKDAFLAAKPDQKLWVKELGTDMQFYQDNYFSAIKSAPINNISRAGAEMYCDWLTTELNAYNAKKGLPSIHPIRLPSRSEWTYAASEGGKRLTYAWNSDSLTYTIEDQQYFSANFRLNSFEGDLSSFFLGYIEPNPEALTTFGYVYGTTFAPSWMGEGGAYGLKHMCGNMAEMVYDDAVPGTAGGGWMSSGEELKINAEDPYTGVTEPHLNIGFRFIIPTEEGKE